MKKEIRIRGLRKRWLINSLGPIVMVALLCIAVFSVSIANYYYTGMRTGLESKAKEAANAFNTYSMNSYNEYIQMARSYTESFQDKDYLELQFIDSNGRIEVSTYGVTAGLMPSTPDITAALTEGERPVIAIIGDSKIDFFRRHFTQSILHHLTYVPSGCHCHRRAIGVPPLVGHQKHEVGGLT